MMFRLSIVTTLMVAFALSFSALVHSQARTQGPLVASAGCFERGVVCLKPSLAD